MHLLRVLVILLASWQTGAQETVRPEFAVSQSTALVPPPAFLLKKFPASIQRVVSENVTLDCAHNPSSPEKASAVTEISRMRILKLDSSNNWDLVAEIRENEEGIHLYDNVLAVGAITSDFTQAFLRIVWPTATDTTFGQYRCDIVGFDDNLNIALERTSTVVIVEHNITATEVLDLLLDERTAFQKELASQRQEEALRYNNILSILNQTIALQSNVIRNMETNVSTWIQQTTNVVTAVENRLINIERQVNIIKQSLAHLTDALPWPEGTYGLLASEYGCPVGLEWKTGFINVHTQSDVINNDYISTPSHVALPMKVRIGNDNYMNLTFCTVTTAVRAAGWPRGSYCINRRGNTCPLGFNSGYVRLDEANAGVAGTSVGNFIDHTRSGTFLLVYYCCRNDDVPDNAIVLPTADPFYLYRFNGTCQEVTGMNVTPEYLIFDTENSANGDLYENDFHPDGSLNDFKLQLCYYE